MPTTLLAMVNVAEAARLRVGHALGHVEE